MASIPNNKNSTYDFLLRLRKISPKKLSNQFSRKINITCRQPYQRLNIRAHSAEVGVALSATTVALFQFIRLYFHSSEFDTNDELITTTTNQNIILIILGVFFLYLCNFRDNLVFNLSHSPRVFKCVYLDEQGGAPFRHR